MSDELKPQVSIDTPEFRHLVDEVYGAGAYGDDDTSEVAALIAHIDAWAARFAGDATKDAERYRHIRGAQWFKAGFAKTKANASAFHYGGELLDSLVDAQIAAAAAAGRDGK